MLTSEEMTRRWDNLDAALKAQFKSSSDKMVEHSARLLEIEQMLVRRPMGGGLHGGALMSPGATVIESEEFKAFGGGARRGKFSVSVKTITAAPASAGSLITPDRRPDVVTLPRQRMTVRSLIAAGETNSNGIEFPRQTVRDLNADVVSEGVGKPQSNIEFELITVPVRTIAHFCVTSRQAMDDAPLLMSTVDGELRYGLQLAEELEMLLGDGTGQHILGIVPQATAYNTALNVVGDTRFDTIAHAFKQAELALLPSTGLVMNNGDLEDLKVVKDLEGRYIGGGPFGPPITAVWGRPVVGTPAMPTGKFLAGAFFDGAQIFDRLTAEVLVSSEDESNFRENKITVRGEERLAMAVKRPQAFVYGQFP